VLHQLQELGAQMASGRTTKLVATAGFIHQLTAALTCLSEWVVEAAWPRNKCPVSILGLI